MDPKLIISLILAILFLALGITFLVMRHNATDAKKKNYLYLSIAAFVLFGIVAVYGVYLALKK